ncbi:hypothetical protein KY311_02015 [Candidatus Woesearchaeota archaeon]|nr:hypothetical protein [Candidatus Woesearchaeota archaeon]
MAEIHDFFGREVEFDYIRDIKMVFQPGILSLPYFFNPKGLENALSELCGFGNKDIQVYFRDFEDVNVVSDGTKKNWWEGLNEFASLVKSHFPAGCELEYWYGEDGEEFSLPEFKETEKPYQAFVRMFGNALQAFSCFVNSVPNNISFSSERTNYHTIKPGEGLVHDSKSMWQGKSKDFMASATMLYRALNDMQRNRYRVGVQEYQGARRREVRIICPQRGAVVGSLYGNDSVALLVENDSLEEIVNQHMRWRKRLVRNSVVQQDRR